MILKLTATPRMTVRRQHGDGTINMLKDAAITKGERVYVVSVESMADGDIIDFLEFLANQEEKILAIFDFGNYGCNNDIDLFHKLVCKPMHEFPSNVRVAHVFDIDWRFDDFFTIDYACWDRYAHYIVE